MLLHGNTKKMRNSALKSYVFLQSTLLADRIGLMSFLPAGFELDFSKINLYSTFFKEAMLKKHSPLKNLLLIGNGAFLFSETFDFKKLKVLKKFLLNTSGLIVYLVAYKSFVFDANRLDKLSSADSCLFFYKELLLSQHTFFRDVFFITKINFILYSSVRLLYVVLLRQIFLISLNGRT